LFCVDDIAGALGRQCRYNGHTRDHYSVAEHAVHVSRALLDLHGDPVLALAGLHHDSPETYLGDVAAPIKAKLGPVFVAMWRALEEPIERGLATWLGIP